MKWRKLGLVYGVNGRAPWAQSHAMLPTPLQIDSETIRVYIGCCDAQGVSRIGFVDLTAQKNLSVKGVSLAPVFDIGERGCFDDNGVVPVSVVRVDERLIYLYYVGFEQCTKVRYRLFTGLAISQDNGTTFSRHSRSPILDRSNAEPLFRCGPCVIKEQNRYRMWYIAGDSWTRVNGKEMPVYDVRYVESSDGIQWPREGRKSLHLSNPDEHGFGRPFVIPDLEGYRMFVSVRKRSVGAYRMGFARSCDGLEWDRCDEQLGLDVSASGWDSQAIMYAAIFDVAGHRLVFYNGNDFGREGFGVAVLQDA